MPAASAVVVAPPTDGTAPIPEAGSGMAGWLITLIALIAALVAATVAVLVERARAARRAAPATTT
jgi:hypothetical protein